MPKPDAELHFHSPIPEGTTREEATRQVTRGLMRIARGIVSSAHEARVPTNVEVFVDGRWVGAAGTPDPRKKRVHGGYSKLYSARFSNIDWNS